ncbi:MAG TPA: alanine dehydrogenase, partial [Bacteroidetes bacterium]|nr:alanine dehydrogenase [Bacteroidota bacterium]
MKVGIIREGKVPEDKRVPFSPKQCRAIIDKYPDIELFVQSSKIRCYADEEYRYEGISVCDKIDHCDVLFGVKEVPIEQLINGKTYFYFSHTHKLQPYNQKLIRSNLEKNICLIDYECLVKPDGQRVLGFGGFAGIVGAYNALMTYGKKYNLFDLKPAHKCKDLEEVKKQLSNYVSLPPIKIVLTGTGRVAGGAQEILEHAGIQEVDVDGFLNLDYKNAVYCNIGVKDYIKHPENNSWEKNDFFKDPKGYMSDFKKFTSVSDIFIAGHFWDNRSPVFFTMDQIKNDDFTISVIADVSCDIAEPIPTTLRSSTIPEPFYDVNRNDGTEKPAFSEKDGISIM